MDPDVLEAARLAFNCTRCERRSRCEHLSPEHRATLDAWLTRAWGEAALGDPPEVAAIPNHERRAIPWRKFKAHGEDGLTDRERDVLALVAQGLTNSEIATTLFIADRSVNTHLRQASKVLSLRGRVRLARWYWERFEREVPESTEEA